MNSNLYQDLNDKQKEAVFHTRGPLLVLAGAGSGKTKVLMYRIAYLIENGVNPFNIMAITFTNKAAKNMQLRLSKLIDEIDASQVWVSTFHSSCYKILRRFIDRLDFDNDFGIYDAQDQMLIIKNIIKRFDLNDKIYKAKSILNFISNCKNEFKSAQQALKEADNIREANIARVYEEYQRELKYNNSLDFDDLIIKAIELFEKDNEVLEYYQKRFEYIMVDEYQDTNFAQFKLIKLLADKYKNLCVVGDDDQSIYKFRGADITNILNFETIYQDAVLIRLEQNYRSKGNILLAANSVIENNKNRKGKTLWTNKVNGNKIRLWQFSNANDEAYAVINDIKKSAEKKYASYAILYRTNAQSRLLGEKCVSLDIPYQIVGGVNFYKRKEIKNIISYLKVISNAKDDQAFKDIINIPKRGIGDVGINSLEEFAKSKDMKLFDAIEFIEEDERLKKYVKKFKDFYNSINEIRELLDSGKGIAVAIKYILENLKYEEYLKLEGEHEANKRLENIGELISKAVDYEKEDLDDFLANIAMFTDSDNFDENLEKVTLMTLHAAKGLEFDHVYMVGMEEGLFPSEMTISSFNNSEMEEERRLCYVGITRAMESLTFTSAKERMINGELKYSRISRFIEEIPKELLDISVLDNINKATKFKDFKESIQEANKEKIFFGKELILQKPKNIDLNVGDRVNHIKFGNGIILEIEEIANDYRISVDFDKFGIKRMSLAFAKLSKIC